MTPWLSSPGAAVMAVARGLHGHGNWGAGTPDHFHGQAVGRVFCRVPETEENSDGP
ncbi:hypothetical protein BN2537_16701 [Streptomyces venezuelae]|nr:hypothetical protein BN2537_16701 [Streptomyces venezuelae]